LFIIVPDFAATHQTVAEIQPFTAFQNGSCLPSWLFKTWKFYLLLRFGDPICVTVPNLWRYGHFSVFQDGRRPPFWIFKSWKFYVMVPNRELMCAIVNFTLISLGLLLAALVLINFCF